MKNTVVLLYGALAAACAVADIRALTPVPQKADPDSWWMKRFNEKRVEREAFATNGAPKVVFVGDSITHGWERIQRGQRIWNRYFSADPFKGYCLGYGGDRTEHVLWRIDHGELDGYEAKAVVLMIGTNNTGHFPLGEETPIDTICGIKAIIDRILVKQPRAKILLNAIFPRGADNTDPMRLRNEAVNRVIAGFCDSWRVVWCDFSERFLYADGRLPQSCMLDLLHPGNDGYCIWANSLLPVLTSAIKGDPVVAFSLPSHLDELRFPLKGPEAAIPAFRYTPTHPRMGDWWWMRRLAERRERIAKSGGQFDLVLLGDSITHHWETRPENADSYAALTSRASVLNCGYAGDMTQNLLWRVQNGELDGYEAKVVVVEIGTNNNTEDRSRPADVAAGVKAVLDAVREKQPNARVVLHPIFPRGFSPQVDAKNNACHAPAHRRNLAANRLLQKLADGKTVFWVDFNGRLADPKTGWTTKELMPDSIHPSDRAYMVWLEALEPFLPPRS